MNCFFCRRIVCRLALGFLAACLSFPAFGQINLSGVWSNRLDEDFPDRLAGPELGDYAGLPINAADRLRGETWDASLITLPEYQCRVHPSDYASAFADIRIWEEYDRDSQSLIRSEERRVGKECRARWWPDHERTKSET